VRRFLVVRMYKTINFHFASNLNLVLCSLNMAFIERKIVKYVTLKIEQKSCSEGTKSHVTEYLWKS